MAAELKHYDIEVEELQDKDKYRAKVNEIFRTKPRKTDTGNQTGNNLSESQ